MGIDFIDRDLRSAMLEDLRTGGNALEQNGYDVSYHIMVFDNSRVSAYDPDPDAALNQFFENMYSTSFIRLRPSTDIVVRLFEEGSRRDVENAVNALLSQVEGKLEIYEAGSEEQSPALRHALVEYRPQIQGGSFQLQGSGESNDYIYEFRDILRDAGLDAEIHEAFR